MAVHGKNAFGPFIGHGLEIPIDPTVSLGVPFFTIFGCHFRVSNKRCSWAIQSECKKN